MSTSAVADTVKFGAETVPVQVSCGALPHPNKVRTQNKDHLVVAQRRRTREELRTDMVPEAKITQVLTGPQNSQLTWQNSISVALSHGGYDNFTVVLDRYSVAPK